MKKFLFILTLTLITSACINAQVFAHYHNGHQQNQYTQTRGGFTGNSNAVYATTAQAKTMKDDSYVTLKGKILSKTGDEKYLFQDKTGTIEIEIDDDKWNGVEAGPNDTVIIEGEVDRDWNKVSIDVDIIKLAK